MPLVVERVGNRIWLKAPWSPGLPDRCKKITGASWRKADKVWTYPLDMIICRDLRAEFGAHLNIGPELYAWASEQRSKFNLLRPLLTAQDADLERVEQHAPLIWEAMNDDECLEPGCSIGSKKHKATHRVKSHRYQKSVVKYGAIARRFQNASQPGLGKTIETLATLVEAAVTGLVLVAAPKTSLRTVWEPEVQRWLPGVPVFATTGSKRRRLDTLEEAKRTWMGGNHDMVIVVVNPEMLRTQTIEECRTPGCDWKCINHRNKGLEEEFPGHGSDHKTMKYYDHDYPMLFEQEWSAFIVDETHRYLLRVNMKSGRGATLAGTGAMLVPLAEPVFKSALSGTPWKGKPRNAWSVRHWLDDSGLGASFWNWAERMLQVDDGDYGKVVGGIGDEATFNAWTDTFMIRHTKAEMAPWLPDKSYGGSRLDPKETDSPIAVWLDMDGKQAKAYKGMLDDAVAHLDTGALTATGVLAERTRLKQFANGYGTLVDRMVKGDLLQEFHPALPSNKFDAMLELLEERGITGDADEDWSSKVVIASQFTRYLNLWHQEFNKKGIPSYLLTGEQGDAERIKAVRDFQTSHGYPVFLLNTMAGGVSVTLDAADDLFFIDETDTPDDQEQVEDRIHRTSKIHNVTIYYLKTRNTVDEVIARQNMSKDEIQKGLLDGKRGVAFARRLLTGE